MNKCNGLNEIGLKHHDFPLIHDRERRAALCGKQLFSQVPPLVSVLMSLLSGMEWIVSSLRKK